MKETKPIKALPFSVYYWIVVLIALIGLADSVYLAISHYRVYNDIAYSSFCALSRAINCDTVSQSPHAILMGLPVPLWGVLAYLFYLILLRLAWKTRDDEHRLWTVLFVTAMAFSLYSIYLALISTFYIKSYCIMCVFDYAINFALLFTSGMVRSRFKMPGLWSGLRQDVRYLLVSKTAVVGLMAPLGGLTLIALVFLPHYWEAAPPLVPSGVPMGLNADGHPWIGAVKPEIEITEFADYQCFQCNKLHYYLRRIVTAHPDKLRIVHRHFPMDHHFNPLIKKPYHQRAGVLALMAIFAAEKGKFWPMNDYLFTIGRRDGPIQIKEVAGAVGLDAEELANAINSPAIRLRLRQDIRDGLKLGLRGTPGFVINGKVYESLLPPEIFQEILEP